MVQSPQVVAFASIVDSHTSIFGYRSQTLTSLMLSLLPGQFVFPDDLQSYESESDVASDELSNTDCGLFLLKTMLSLLQDIGFNIPSVSEQIALVL